MCFIIIVITSDVLKSEGSADSRDQGNEPLGSIRGGTPSLAEQLLAYKKEVCLMELVRFVTETTKP
jgi:hypothetical protein